MVPLSMHHLLDQPPSDALVLLYSAQPIDVHYFELFGVENPIETQTSCHRGCDGIILVIHLQRYLDSVPLHLCLRGLLRATHRQRVYGVQMERPPFARLPIQQNRVHLVDLRLVQLDHLLLRDALLYHSVFVVEVQTMQNHLRSMVSYGWMFASLALLFLVVFFYSVIMHGAYVRLSHH